MNDKPIKKPKGTSASWLLGMKRVLGTGIFFALLSIASKDGERWISVLLGIISLWFLILSMFAMYMSLECEKYEKSIQE